MSLKNPIRLMGGPLDGKEVEDDPRNNRLSFECGSPHLLDDGVLEVFYLVYKKYPTYNVMVYQGVFSYNTVTKKMKQKF